MPLCPNCSIEFMRRKQNPEGVIALKKINKVGNTILYYCSGCNSYYTYRIQTLRCPVCNKVMRHIYQNIYQCKICMRVYDASRRPMEYLYTTSDIPSMKSVQVV